MAVSLPPDFPPDLSFDGFSLDGASVLDLFISRALAAALLACEPSDSSPAYSARVM